MQHASGKLGVSTFVAVLALSVLSGCSELPTWVPFTKETPDRLPGVPTPAEKLAALRKLVKDAPSRNAEEKQRVVHDLTKALPKELDPMIRAEIITTLAHYPHPETDRVLQAAIRDSDVDVRITACRAWAIRGGPEATKTLATMLSSDADKDVRLAAAKSLGQSKDAAAVAALGGALDDPDPAMQYVAVGSLRSSTGKDFGNDVNQWRQYVKGETPKPDRPISVAEQLRKMF
jgi:HEAT repeat protein